MNREIKFRGKNDYGKWEYGDLIQYENGDKAIISKMFTKYGYEATELCKRTKVLSDSVGQFTRLRDIESKEIYDGDIITVRDIYQKEDYVGCIRGESSTYDYGVYFINHPLKNLWTLNDAFFYYGGNVKVIGNIFDNPELMEK